MKSSWRLWCCAIVWIVFVGWFGCEATPPRVDLCKPDRSGFAAHPDWQGFKARVAVGQPNGCLQMAWQRLDAPGDGAFAGAATTLAHLDDQMTNLSQIGEGKSPFVGLAFPPQQDAYRYRFRFFLFAPRAGNGQTSPTDASVCEGAMAQPGYDCLQDGRCALFMELRLSESAFRGKGLAIDGDDSLACRAYLRSVEPPQEPTAEPAAEPDAAPEDASNEPASEPIPEEPAPERLCQPDQTRPCYQGPDDARGVGVCKAGQERCLDGMAWSACVDQVVPSDEICNGKDDDCDGQIDESFPEQFTTCKTNKTPCETSQAMCIKGQLQCPERQPAAQEICGNYLDDDCDGKVDLRLGRCDWLRGVDGGTADTITRVLTLPDGGVAILGVMRSRSMTFDFGWQPTTQSGTQALFVGRLDASGEWMWVKLLEDTGGKIIGWEMVADAQGNVYIVGQYMGSMSVGSTKLLDSQGRVYGFVAKLDPAGKWLWAQYASGNYGAVVSGIALGADGTSLAIVGKITRQGVLFGKSLTINDDDVHYFVTALDLDGKRRWHHDFAVYKRGEPVTDLFLPKVRTHLSLGFVTTGSYRQFATLDRVLPSPSQFGVYVAAISASGVWRWSVLIDGDKENYDYLYDIAVSPSGRIAVAGALSKGTVTLGGVTLDPSKHAGTYLGFLDERGQWRHAMPLHDKAFRQVPLSISYDGRDQLFVAGTAPSSVFFLGSFRITSRAQYTHFLAALNPQHKWLWAVNEPAFDSLPSAPRGIFLSVFSTPHGDLSLGGHIHFDRFGAHAFPAAKNTPHIFVGRNLHHPDHAFP